MEENRKTKANCISENSDEGREVGLYVHIPFCRRKCLYCDFSSYPSMERHIPAYLAALKKELSEITGDRKGLAVKSIFIGGGTPSLLGAEEIDGLLRHISRCVVIKSDAEITLESNPGTLDEKKLRGYRAAGVNRLSIGLQAWQDRLLKTLGRIHTSEEFVEGFRSARKAGFENINVDLIFGIPGQAPGDWEETLSSVVALGPEHLSCYSLIIEQGTVFGDLYEKGELQPVDDELDRAMYRKAIEYLTARGYRHYEISNFAMEGFECRHNLIYWKAQEYIGIGAAAHSYIDGVRRANTADVLSYIESINNGVLPVVERQNIDTRESMSEYMILGLRLIKGVSFSEFFRRYGVGVGDIFGERIDRLVERGLLIKDDDRIFLTEKGLDLANSVFLEFID